MRFVGWPTVARLKRHATRKSYVPQSWAANGLLRARRITHCGRAALAAPRVGVSPAGWARCVGSPSMNARGEAF
eukprot:9362728-Alexandrium_andersonii.AAC.1